MSIIISQRRHWHQSGDRACLLLCPDREPDVRLRGPFARAPPSIHCTENILETVVVWQSSLVAYPGVLHGFPDQLL